MSQTWVRVRQNESVDRGMWSLKEILANQLVVPYPSNIKMTHYTGLTKLHMTVHGFAWLCMALYSMPSGACHESITIWGPNSRVSQPADGCDSWVWKGIRTRNSSWAYWRMLEVVPYTSESERSQNVRSCHTHVRVWKKPRCWNSDRINEI